MCILIASRNDVRLLGVCALIYNIFRLMLHTFRLMLHASPTKMMAIGDELQHAVYTCNILSMQDDRIINFNSFTPYLRLK